MTRMATWEEDKKWVVSKLERLEEAYGAITVNVAEIATDMKHIRFSIDRDAQRRERLSHNIWRLAIAVASSGFIAIVGAALTIWSRVLGG